LKERVSSVPRDGIEPPSRGFSSGSRTTIIKKENSYLGPFAKAAASKMPQIPLVYPRTKPRPRRRSRWDRIMSDDDEIV
jgi:hypothetical protein